MADEFEKEQTTQAPKRKWIGNFFFAVGIGVFAILIPSCSTNQGELLRELDEVKTKLAETEAALIEAQSYSRVSIDLPNTKAGAYLIRNLTWRFANQMGILAGLEMTLKEDFVKETCETSMLSMLEKISKEYFEQVPTEDEDTLFFYQDIYLATILNTQTHLDEKFESFECDVLTSLSHLYEEWTESEPQNMTSSLTTSPTPQPPTVKDELFSKTDEEIKAEIKAHNQELLGEFGASMVKVGVDEDWKAYRELKLGSKYQSHRDIIKKNIELVGELGWSIVKTGVDEDIAAQQALDDF